MSTTSKAAAIAAAIAARLATITRANGYHTNAGLHVWRGRTAIDADELPSITLFEQEDQVEDQRITTATDPTAIDAHLLLPFVVEASTHCDPDHPNLAGHALVADIKRAIFSGDLTWGSLASHTRYIGRTLGPREGGADIVTVTVQIRIGYTENLATA
ncbi:MAG: hypothetical protein RBT67_07710 [Thauera sp.]|jgi:hypothetical protein|nr:hypothetical protein [Thauera sp.]